MQLTARCFKFLQPFFGCIGYDALEEPSSDRGRLFALREDGDGISRGISPVISERCRVVLKPVKARRAFVYKYIVAPLITLAGVGVLIGIRQLIDRFVG